MTTSLAAFSTQLKSFNPLTVRSLARWQRQELIRRNPLLSAVVANLTDEGIVAQYLRACFEERERLRRYAEKQQVRQDAWKVLRGRR
jgi:hypothetical protein